MKDMGRGQDRVALVADDDVAVRRLLRHFLEKDGYCVIEANDGCEALAILQFRQHPFDLLVTDIVMPGMNGIELSRNVKQKMPELPILVVSGNFSAEANDFVASSQGVYKLEKPFIAEHFRNMVQSVMADREALSENVLT